MSVHVHIKLVVGREDVLVVTVHSSAGSTEETCVCGELSSSLVELHSTTRAAGDAGQELRVIWTQVRLKSVTDETDHQKLQVRVKTPRRNRGATPDFQQSSDRRSLQQSVVPLTFLSRNT